MQELIAEKRKRSTLKAEPKTPREHRLKSGAPSGMDARESLAEGSCRNGDLRHYLRADQRSPAEDPAIEPTGRCLAGSGVDGFNRRHDPGARVSRGQLRHAGPVARHDADLGISLSGALFRMGGRRRPEILTHAATSVALSDAYVGDSVRVARQRYDLFNADAASSC